MVLTIMARFIAIMLSIAAGIISVIGLASIFSGAYTAVILITSLLEAAKVIVATWLHQNWGRVSKRLRWYLGICVIILMAITSVGIYGFFARAHIQQQVAMETGDVTKLPVLESKIQIQAEKIAAIDSELQIQKDATQAVIDKGRARDAKEILSKQEKKKKGAPSYRETLLDDKSKVLEEISVLKAEKAEIEARVKSFEVEVGPLRYVAALYYGGDATQEQLETAVRWLIIILIFVFDPLAIALLMASNKQLDTSMPSLTVEPDEPDIPDEDVMEMPSKIAKRKYTKRKSRKLDNPISISAVPPKRPRRRRNGVLDLSHFKP